MPSVVENRIKWSEHAWSLEGHEWSPGGSAAGTDLLWWRTIRPRIHACVPAADILEIAPGFGRWTAHLLRECKRLVAVDVTERCVEVCRTRFSGAPAEFWLNDGESLPMLGDASIDFAFSFDSLVHVEAPQLRSYVRELRRVLKPGGLGFLHHSNLGAYADASGRVARYVAKRHWRAPSVSARVFREACREAGLACLTQEVINWIGRGVKADRHRLRGEYVPLTDCVSMFGRPAPGRTPPYTEVYVNPHFVHEWRQLVVLAALYGRRDPEATTSTDPRVAPLPASRIDRLRRAIGRDGFVGTASRLGGTLAAAAEPMISRARETAAGWRYASREPLVRRIASGVCPECLARLETAGPGRGRCCACRVSFVLA